MLSVANPAFRSDGFRRAGSLSVAELEDLYGGVSRGGTVDGGRVADGGMTFDGVVIRTVFAFTLLGVFAAAGWFMPVVTLPAAVAGFVLALVNIFKKVPSPPLVLSYAAVQGLFVGGLSNIFNTMWEGIVAQTVFGTIAVVATVALLYSSGRIRTSPKTTRFVVGLMLGYLVFSLVNFGLVLTGVSDSMFGLRTSVELFGLPLGLILGVVAVFLAVYSLMMDFDYIKNGVGSKLPEVFSWRAAFGLTLTVVWLYVEILRLLAILRGD